MGVCEKGSGMIAPTLFQLKGKKLIIKRNSMNNALALLFRKGWDRRNQEHLPHGKMSKNRIIFGGLSCLTTVKVYSLKGFVSTEN